MLRTEQKKIVILEKDHAQRDFLRSFVAAGSDLAFYFDRVALCFDNLAQLDPDLIVVGTFPRKVIFRFINAHRATECKLPSLLLTQDSEIKQYLELNSLDNIKIYDSQPNLNTMNGSIAKALSAKKKDCNNNGYPFIVGKSSGIVQIKKMLPALNSSRENVFIEGEVGSGKEMIARAIHSLSDAKKDLFIKISAQKLRSGSFYLHLVKMIEKMIQENICDNGLTRSEITVTIFIDELGYLPDTVQSEFLLLFDDVLGPLNSLYRKVQTKIRIIASTSVGSNYLLEENRLRNDLLYRLNVVNVKIEPLRQRKEDIPLLADYFVYRQCKNLGRSFFELSDETIDMFMRYHWPGNTKELESIIKRIVIKGSAEDLLKVAHPINQRNLQDRNTLLFEFSEAIDTITISKEYIKQAGNMQLKNICSKFLASIEIDIIQKVLKKTSWNRKKAATMLNISYKSMLNKIKEYGLV